MDNKLLRRFCKMENTMFNCRLPYCEYTCPVARFVDWGGGTYEEYVKCVYSDLPEEAKKAVLSEVLGDDVEVIKKILAGVRERAVELGGLDEFNKYMGVE